VEGHPKETIQRPTGKVVQGEADATRLTAQTLSQVEKLLCVCGDREVPRVFAESVLFRDIFLGVKSRGIEVRFVTEITQDNIQYCRKIAEEYGFELRHLDGIKGNFGVADRKKQYWTSARVQNSEGEMPQLMWSDVPAIVEQNQYVFDLLWNKAIPIEVRFIELEHGVTPQRTEVIFGEENVSNTITRIISNARTRIHACIDSLGPSVSLSMEPVRLAISDSFAKRKISPKYITEITPENIGECRRLIELGVELRHLDSVKGNFGVTDDEYCATSTLEGSRPILQLVYSNSKAVVEQNEYLFQTLWSRATPVNLRFKEIVEGIPRYETRIIRDSNQILVETKRMIDSSKRYSVSSVSGGLLYAYSYAFGDFDEILEKARRGEHEGIKWVTRIDESSLEAAKKFLEKGMLLRHVDNVPTESFGVSDREVGVTLSRLENGAMNNSALFSNDPMYIEHYSGVFEELWKSGIDAKIRIKEIEEGIEEPRIRIIRNRDDVRVQLLHLLNHATEEILLLLPSSNSYRRLMKIGVIDAMQKAVQRGVKVSLLAPSLNEKQDDDQKNQIEYKAIREATGLNTVTIVVVDRTRSLIIEQQDDSKQDFVESIGVATYSTRGSTVKANIRFFERMWEEVAEREREEMLLEKERRSRMEAELLQDILAHDIRNYNQAARLNAELLADELGEAPPESLKPLVDSVINSIDGSTRLVDRAAKIGKILSDGSNVNLVPVNLADIIETSIATVRESQRGKKEIFIEKPGDLDKKSVMADDMLQEVFLNLFSNSAKYTDGSEARITLAVEELIQNGGAYYKISVSDQSHGIPEEQKPNLFTRYLKSARGSGLGLSIVHALVSDRYLGGITVRDRVTGDPTKGTIMEILLPRA